MPQSPYLPADVASARHIACNAHGLLATMAAADAHEIRTTAWSVLAENHAALHPRSTPTTPARIIPIPLAVFQMHRRHLHLHNGGDAA